MIKFGLYVEYGDSIKTINPILKMVRNGVANNGYKLFSKEDFVKYYNEIIYGVRAINERGLQNIQNLKNEDLTITTENVFFNEEVDEFLKEHEVDENGLKYYSADNKFFFIVFDQQNETETIRRV